MFSLPINQKISEEQFHEFFNFCSEHKDLIFDLYFTCRMPPFIQDAMGDVITSDEDVYAPIHTAIHIQKELGITVSATFNNIEIPPTQKNLDIFIENFQQLYDAGIRSITLPHTHWVATNQIQKRFPDLYIKNTILRNVNRAAEVAKCAESGFNYVNLDRDLMRNRDELIKCRKAADKYGIKLSLLANEGCLGNCPMMDEHFQFNNNRQGGAPYFKDAISRVSCPKWDITDLSTPLKTANIPPWKEDWDDLFQYVDVFKLHGRESIQQFFNSIDIVKRYKLNETILVDGFEDYIELNNLEDKPINAWRKIIKNCKFDCWDCNYCDKIHERKSEDKPHKFITAIVNELVDSVNYKNNINIPGLTSSRVQNLLFGLSEHVNSYLEIGSAMGATTLAVGGNDIDIHCVDKWEDDIQPQNDFISLPSNTIDEFRKNTKHIKKLHIHDGDYLSIDKSNISNIEMMFYDGPHDQDSTTAAVKYYSECLADTAILVFDDANWRGVVAGAEDGIEESGLKIIYNKLLLNDVEDSTMWWNGLYIVVVQK